MQKCDSNVAQKEVSGLHDAAFETQDDIVPEFEPTLISIRNK